jgi:hypothetical protein
MYIGASHSHHAAAAILLEAVRDIGFVNNADGKNHSVPCSRGDYRGLGLFCVI